LKVFLTFVVFFYKGFAIKTLRNLILVL